MGDRCVDTEKKRETVVRVWTERGGSKGIAKREQRQGGKNDVMLSWQQGAKGNNGLHQGKEITDIGKEAAELHLVEAMKSTFSLDSEEKRGSLNFQKTIKNKGSKEIREQKGEKGGHVIQKSAMTASACIRPREDQRYKLTSIWRKIQGGAIEKGSKKCGGNS